MEHCLSFRTLTPRGTQMLLHRCSKLSAAAGITVYNQEWGEENRLGCYCVSRACNSNTQHLAVPMYW